MASHSQSPSVSCVMLCGHVLEEVRKSGTRKEHPVHSLRFVLVHAPKPQAETALIWALSLADVLKLVDPCYTGAVGRCSSADADRVRRLPAPLGCETVEPEALGISGPTCREKTTVEVEKGP
ncbi:unnamed protein product [Symbiodinium natans]|uniref:Uncharacterized protein n=1 Tax=Symbiodinium natans TaxID=878477 RepID=A0A812LCA2_9DINO|nr:unnamed protein product [Symbiodinium natans]